MKVEIEDDTLIALVKAYADAHKYTPPAKPTPQPSMSERFQQLAKVVMELPFSDESKADILSSFLTHRGFDP